MQYRPSSLSALAPPLTLPSPIQMVRVAGENWKGGDPRKVNLQFDAAGLMKRHLACINALPVAASERRSHSRLGSRPDKHPDLTALGFRSMDWGWTP
jgi:nuclear transport factor 2 (NTF2) superfamily protein